MAYVVSSRLKCILNIKHSHAIHRDAVRASARRLISFEKELSQTEVAYIEELGPAILGATKVRDILRLKYPERDYDGQLLHRLLRRGFTKQYGEDPDAIEKLIWMVGKART